MSRAKSEIVSRISELVEDFPDRDLLIQALAVFVEKEIEAERYRCAELCRSRAELWRRTPAAHAPMPAAREEARARANEAAFLADALETGLPLSAADDDTTN